MITKLLVAGLAGSPFCFAVPSSNAYVTKVGTGKTRPKVTWITSSPTPHSTELTSSLTDTTTSAIPDETPSNATKPSITPATSKQTEVLFSGYQAYASKGSKKSTKGSKVFHDTPEPFHDQPRDSDNQLSKPSTAIVSPRPLPTLSPSGRTQAPIQSPSHMPQKSVLTQPPPVPHGRDPCKPRPKWHLKVGFDMCTNSPEYPENWKPKEIYDTLQQCCRVVFAATGICKFEDVCSRPSTSGSSTSGAMQPSYSPSTELPSYSPTVKGPEPTPQPSAWPSAKPSTQAPSEPHSPEPTPHTSVSPTAKPSTKLPSKSPTVKTQDPTPPPASMPSSRTGPPLQTKAQDTLSPTPAPADDGLPRINSHPPGVNVTCVCTANEPEFNEGTSSPTEQPTTLFPTSPPKIYRSPSPSTEPPFYTDLPTKSPAKQASSTNRAVRKSYDTQSYQLDAMEIGSNEYNNFVVTSHKETKCFKVSSDESEECKLDCMVTISLYHDDILIHEPTTDTYDTFCPEAGGTTVSTRSLETHTFAVDSTDALHQDNAN